LITVPTDYSALHKATVACTRWIQC